MKRLFAILILAASGLAQETPAPKAVTLCWTPEGGEQTCQTFQPGSVTMVTLDLRQTPLQYVVVQPLPDYMITSMQKDVNAQVYNMQQADNSVVTKARYSSVQDKIIQYLLRSLAIPCLKLYPPTGPDADKTTYEALRQDLLLRMTLATIP